MKLTKDQLKSKYSTITLSNHKSGHLKINIKFDDGIYYKLNINQLTSIKSDLSIFERKVVLIHMYKLLDRFKTNPNGLKSEVDTNYAGVFGSPWL